MVFLLAPTSNAHRMDLVSRLASGFLYYVSFKGVTGANRLDVGAVSDKLQELRRHTRLPVGVGFGIRDAASAAQVAAVADAVVVGSVLVSQVAALAGEPEKIAPALAATVAEMRAAIDAATRKA
jgi:tryptophan synthase alpha chain